MSDASPQSRAEVAQRAAADPGLSAFVSANAGSGKTTVLVNRVLRLLLSGAPPVKILCLTYTKAAAAHMALKVFERLAGWVDLDDEALTKHLTALDGAEPDPVRLTRARQLFARAVETPGGLKIETIHAFCERILHLFPFEANVPARFEVLDEAASAELLAQARREILTQAATGAREDLADALHLLSLEASGDTFDEALNRAIAEREFLKEGLARAGGLEAAMDALGRALGLLPADTREGIERAMLEDGLPPAEWRAIADVLDAGKATDRDRAADLRAASVATTPEERLHSYLAVFFSGGKVRSDRFLTKSIDPALVERMRNERDRLDGLMARRKAALVVGRTHALFSLAAAIARRVDGLKRARGALDFDDLIAKTRTLLTRSDAAWVLYKLDAGIDHVLVDEAQDTNPAQWAILKALTADFAAGESARPGLVRTIFAVGDPKQSIYGFQGAEPREFALSERHFRATTLEAGGRFERVPLTVSFRSAPAVLAAVDAVFALPAHAAGLSFDADGAGDSIVVHESSRLGPDARGVHGRVEVWPLVRAKEEPDPDAWSQPLDETQDHAPPVRLAARIAENVKQLIAGGGPGGRPVPAGEVLILVRKRGPLFVATIRALKQAGVPVAGADRLRIGEHIAVLDLVAVGQAAILPADDLSLAAVLKSPLVGLIDEDLIEIGARRPDRASFADALKEAAGRGYEPAQRALLKLDRWRDLAQRYGAFGFYSILLGPDGGRRDLIARLGAEAGDAIDEFLSLAFAHEKRETPSLSLFLSRFAASEHQVKRDMDARGGEVRVMTVHGAKGLEAEVVIVADGCNVQGPRAVLMPFETGAPGAGLEIPVWMPKKDDMPPVLATASGLRRDREREEHNRLLYVAMTRAKDRLVIAPYIGKNPKAPPPESWYAMVAAGLRAAQLDGSASGRGPSVTLQEVECPGFDEPVLVWESGTHTGARAEAQVAAFEDATPDWLHRPLPVEAEPPAPLRPSLAIGAADGTGTETARPAGPLARMARLRGTLVHALLEALPGFDPPLRDAAAARILKARAASLDETERLGIAVEALRILDDPDLEALFGPGSRAEVPLAGTLPARPGAPGLAISGQVDRLAVTGDEVLVADFKTTAAPPQRLDAAPASHVAQLALYRGVLARIFPGKGVRAFLVYTAGPIVIEIPAERLDDVLQALQNGERSIDDAAMVPS